jgi:hypothetical protein
MSFKIHKHTDDVLVLSSHHGLVDFLVRIIFLAFGGFIMSVGVTEFQETSELLWPLTLFLFGAGFFFPVFRSRKLIINAQASDITHSKSWFGVVTNKAHILNSQLPLIEISGLLDGEVLSFFDPSEPVTRRYYLTLFSHTKMRIQMSSFSQLLEVVAFFEDNFDTELAMVIDNHRHKFSTQGLMDNFKPTPLPKGNRVWESGLQQLSIGGQSRTSLGFWIVNSVIWAWSLGCIALLHSQEKILLAVLLPPIWQTLISLALLVFTVWFGIYLTGANKLTIANDTLTVTRAGLKTKQYKLSDVWGVAKVTRVTELLTRKGAVPLSSGLSREHSFAVHSWLAQFTGSAYTK